MIPSFCQRFPFHVVSSPDNTERVGGVLASDVVRLDLQAGNLTDGPVLRCHGHKLVVIGGKLVSKYRSVSETCHEPATRR
jgi:hypothetical protein